MLQSMGSKELDMTGTKLQEARLQTRAVFSGVPAAAGGS